MPSSLASPRRVPVLASLGVVVAASTLWLGLSGVPCWAQASAPVAAASSPAQVDSSAASSADKRPVISKSASAAKSNGKQPTKPLWTELTEAQRQALAPLAPKWDTVSEAQKRKWLAMSQNYPRMSGAEQEKLHSRMTEWAALSPQQRTQARLNFGEAKQIPPDDKKAKWEAYQALPPEEKSKLAASAAKPPATAAAVKPVPPDKLATVPPPKRVVKAPRIAAGAHQVDQNTLLPQPAPAGPN
jgi:hypothetical protein